MDAKMDRLRNGWIEGWMDEMRKRGMKGRNE